MKFITKTRQHRLPEALRLSNQYHNLKQPWLQESIFSFMIWTLQEAVLSIIIICIENPISEFLFISSIDNP